MPCKIYGEKFRKIRNQKQIPLSYFHTVGVEKSDLSKFERGLTMMGFEKIDMMLQAMNVSLAEYELIINNFVPGFQEVFLNEIDEADFNQEKSKLVKLYEEAKESGYGLLAIATKARYNKLQDEEIQYVIDFLNKIKEWGYFELSVLYFVLDDLSTEDFRRLFSDFEAKSHNYYGLPKYSRRILQIAYRAVAILSSRNEKNFVDQIIQATNNRNKGLDIYIDNVRRMALGVYDYYFVNQEQGKAKIKESLDIFSLLEHDELRDYYLKRTEHFFKEEL